MSMNDDVERAFDEEANQINREAVSRLSNRTDMDDEKPPIGIRPQAIWEFATIEDRILEIVGAIIRYRENDFTPKVEWYRELSARTASLVRLIDAEGDRIRGKLNVKAVCSTEWEAKSPGVEEMASSSKNLP